jgi:hypothetical protein
MNRKLNKNLRTELELTQNKSLYLGLIFGSSISGMFSFHLLMFINLLLSVIFHFNIDNDWSFSIYLIEYFIIFFTLYFLGYKFGDYHFYTFNKIKNFYHEE